MALRSGDWDDTLAADLEVDLDDALAAPAPTLLPSPIAHAVSLATRSSCLAIRAGTFVGSYGFDAAKFATISSLELGRGVLESILTRAGRDVVSRSRSRLSREEAESVIERSLESLHHAMTQIVFWTTTGFHVTSSTVSAASEISQLLLFSLDQFFGSTDSSRAIASIVDLIRREFQNPSTGVSGERVGVVDLMLGLCAMAYLQRLCRRHEDAEARRLGHEEIVWDVVVLNNGDRIDIHEDSLYGVHARSGGGPGDLVPHSHSQTSKPPPAAILQGIRVGASAETSEDESDDDDDLPEIRLKKQIVRSIPPDTSVSISTSIKTTKTITVDFNGPSTVQLAPPPGVEVVQDGLSPSGPRPSRASPSTYSHPTQRFVYRVDRDRTRSTTLRKFDDGDDDDDGDTRFVEEVDASPKSVKEAPTTTAPPPTSKKHPLSPPPHPAPPMPPPKRVSSAPRGMAAPAAAQPRNPPFRSKSPNATRKGNPVPDEAPTRPRFVSRHSTGGPFDRSARGNEANQKRQRAPLTDVKSKENVKPSRSAQQPEKRGGLRNALKMGSSTTLSHLWNHSNAAAPDPPAPQNPRVSKNLGSPNPSPAKWPLSGSGPGGARPTLEYEINPSTLPRSPSRSSYISIHEHTRDSFVSQTDTYSIHSTDDIGPPSPISVRAEPRDLGAGIGKSLSEKNMGGGYNDVPPPTVHRRVRSHINAPSLYSIASNDSQTSLVRSSYYQRSAYSNSEALNALRSTGMVDGTFPRFHILRNITRYILFSSASYGSNFLKFMGISKEMPILRVLDDTHHDIRSFARHTQSQADSILLASFVDPQGGSDSTGSTNTGFPLVHYISLDHESKAVVLACRGTLGFEDVLADMTCDYDDLSWRGKVYKVHKGIHASARRLLYGGDGRILLTLKETLDEFQDYGLVLCGHSLGGAVTALLGVMLSEPNTGGTNFVTSAEPHNRLYANKQEASGRFTHLCLPPGRPIHVYAYGPPGTMSPSLRHATRGLITTVVQGHDLVPYLSLGVLRDFQAVALAFKKDSGSTKAEIRQRVWRAFQDGLAQKWYGGATSPNSDHSEPNDWALPVLQTLRSTMTCEKLLPPGEVFIVETTRVLRRDAFLLAGEDHIGRPARRIVLKYVRNVEAQFREVRFGTSMLVDHSPAKYEDTLNRLRLGVVETAF